jgi:hypothetical protein
MCLGGSFLMLILLFRSLHRVDVAIVPAVLGFPPNYTALQLKGT